MDRMTPLAALHFDVLRVAASGIQAHAAAVLHDELFHKAAVEGVHVAGVNGLCMLVLDGILLKGEPTEVG